MRIACAAFAVFYSFGAQAASLPAHIAAQVQAAYNALPKPNAASDPFTKWVYDTAGFTAVHCIRKAGGVPDKMLANSRPLQTGVWALPTEAQAVPLCISIARDGFRPACVSGNYWVDVATRSPQWPIDYLQMHSETDPVQGMLQCYLDAASAQPQPFVAYPQLTWTEHPQRNIINTASGPKDVVRGNVLITDRYARGSDGKPFTKPVIVVLQDSK